MEYEYRNLIEDSIDVGEWEHATESEDFKLYQEARTEIDCVYSKADSLDRTANHIATERWNLAEDLIGEDDEDVRRQILAEIAFLTRIKDVMEVEHDVD